MPTRLPTTTILWQKGKLLWLYLPLSPAKMLDPYFEAVACLVQKSQMESRQYFGGEPNMSNGPHAKQQID